MRSVTGGNGAIYATRREAYLVVDPIMGHDLSFPFNMVKRGWRAVYAPEAQRQREDGPHDRGRVRAQAADDEPHAGRSSLRGRDALAARLRPAVRADDRLAPDPALPDAVPARGRARRRASRCSAQGWVYVAAVAVQAAVLLAAALAGAVVRARPLLIARYYVLTTASLAAGLWDWLAHGTPAGWEPAEGTR